MLLNDGIKASSLEKEIDLKITSLMRQYSAYFLLGKYLITPVVNHITDSFDEVNKTTSLMNRYVAELINLTTKFSLVDNYFILQAFGVPHSAPISLIFSAYFEEATLNNMLSSSAILLSNMVLMFVPIGLCFKSDYVLNGLAITFGVIAGVNHSSEIELAHGIDSIEHLINTSKKYIEETCFEALCLLNNDNVFEYIGLDSSICEQKEELV